MGSDGPGRRRGLAVLDPGPLESWGARLTDETICGHLKGLVRAAPWGHRARGGCPFLSASFFMEISASPSTLSPVVLSSCSVTLVLFPERDFFFFNFLLKDNCFIGFCCFCQTSTCIRHRYTDVPSLLNLPPIFLKFKKKKKKIERW